MDKHRYLPLTAPTIFFVPVCYRLAESIVRFRCTPCSRSVRAAGFFWFFFRFKNGSSPPLCSCLALMPQEAKGDKPYVPPLNQWGSHSSLNGEAEQVVVQQPPLPFRPSSLWDLYDGMQSSQRVLHGLVTRKATNTSGAPYTQIFCPLYQTTFTLLTQKTGRPLSSALLNSKLTGDASLTKPTPSVPSLSAPSTEINSTN